MLESSDFINSISILIDGGPSQTYQKHLKPTLDLILPDKKLDLVILSHIDNDHVVGLLDLFEAIKREKESGSSEVLKVSGLWHNSFSDLIGSNSDANKLLRNLFSSDQFFAIEKDNKINDLFALSALKGISEGRELTKLAQNLHIPINSQFGGDLIVARKDNRAIKLQNLKFYILGPTQKNLEKLRKIWNSWVRSHPQIRVTSKDYEDLQVLDASITNLSSLMFMVESEGKKLLFTGDGLADDVTEMLLKKGLLDSQGRYHVHLMKVPHHGSERNASREFFDTVTADAYVISANGRDDNPSIATLQWIIESKRNKNKVIKIFLTNRTNNTDKILQQYDQKKFQYRFHFLEKESHSFEIPLN